LVGWGGGVLDGGEMLMDSLFKTEMR
jgi:hypothetical protein